MLTQEFINTVLQVVVVLGTALIFWAIFGRRHAGFRDWIGLGRPSTRSMKAALIIALVWSAVSIAVYVVPVIYEAAIAPGTIAGSLRAHDFTLEVLAVLLMVALIKTSFAEEILFRGLIGKRLIHRLGFGPGNFIQAALFGSVHVLIFLVPGGPELSILLAVIIFLLTGTAGWFMGYANEHIGNGSIIPGWTIHAVGNTVLYAWLAYVI